MECKCNPSSCRMVNNTKTANRLNTIYDALLAARSERSTPLIALGGGVIGDITGYAAATYLRGVPFIQIPTTLLSQVDSSVGGKTGINHPLGKNMIGAFYQPRVVLADTTTLNTLPDKELRAGIAEVIKYGLIRDLPFLEWLEANIEKLLARDTAALQYAIARSCQNKAEVVGADERESGERALLNLGHTFGHAIENGMGYGVWLHGEAVAAGTIMATDLSQRLGWLSEQDVARVRKLFERAGLPVVAPRLGAEKYLQLMGLDKKVVDGKIRFVLLKSLGDAVMTGDVPQALSGTDAGGMQCLSCNSLLMQSVPARVAERSPNLHRRAAANFSATATASFTPPPFAASNTRRRSSSITKATCSAPALPTASKSRRSAAPLRGAWR